VGLDRHSSQTLIGAMQFPYALHILDRDLANLWDDGHFRPYKTDFPEEHQASPAAFMDHVKDLVAQDIKAPYLKRLQGFLWHEGYRNGQLRAPLFADVAPALAQWKSLGIITVIYSSGSVPAQKLFFAHTNAQPSDLTSLITAWFDTVNAGPKTDSASYASIMSKFPGSSPSQWLFLSDSLAEVDAARASGMQSLPVMRPGNQPVPPHHHLASSIVTSLGQVEIDP
jgi:enolase-phosphatase E1